MNKVTVQTTTQYAGEIRIQFFRDAREKNPLTYTCLSINHISIPNWYSTLLLAGYFRYIIDVHRNIAHVDIP